MAKPTNLAEWATSGGAPVTEPLLAQKQAGWSPGTRLPAQWLNWWMKTVYSWIVYLNGFTSELLTWTAEQTHTRRISIDTTGVDQSCVIARSPTGNSPAIHGFDSFTGVKGATSSTSTNSSGVYGSATAGAGGRFWSDTGPAVRAESTGGGLALEAIGIAHVSQDLEVGGQLLVEDTAVFNGDTQVSGTSLFLGPSTFSSAATFSSTSTFNGNVTINGAPLASEALKVVGPVTPGTTAIDATSAAGAAVRATGGVYGLLATKSPGGTPGAAIRAFASDDTAIEVVCTSDIKAGLRLAPQTMGAMVPTAGQLWFDAPSGKLKYHNGVGICTIATV
jgi:hypothetical protein